MHGLSAVTEIAEVIGFYFAKFFCDAGLGDFHAADAQIDTHSWTKAKHIWECYLDLFFYVAVRIGMAVTNKFAGYECHTPQLCNRPMDQMAYMLWRCRRWWSIPNGAIPWIRLKDRNLRCIIGMRRCMNMRKKGMSDSVTEQFQLTPTKSS